MPWQGYDIFIRSTDVYSIEILPVAGQEGEGGGGGGGGPFCLATLRCPQVLRLNEYFEYLPKSTGSISSLFSLWY